MKRIILILLAVLVTFSATAQAAGPPVTTLTLASVDNIPPYVYRENGKLTGLSVDILHELARRGGFHISIVTMPWARVLLQVEQGVVDGAFSAYKTARRQGFALYTGIIHYDQLRVATRREMAFTFKGIESLYGKVVGKGRRVYVGETFDRAVAAGKITLEETDDMKYTNIRKLRLGRLDAVIGSPGAMRHYANKLGIADQIVILPGALRDQIPAYLILSKSSGLVDKVAWQWKLKAILREMWADGAIKAINARYGVTDD